MKKLKKFRIENLYGIYSHEVEMSEEPIRLLLGDNGIGKTMSLRLISWLMKGDFSSMLAVPFDMVEVTFDDGCVLKVKSFETENNVIDLQIMCYTPDGGWNEDNFSGIQNKRSSGQRKLKVFFPNYFRQVDDEFYRDMRTKEYVSRDEMVEKFMNVIPMSVIKEVAYPDWLYAIMDDITVNFVEAQRLLTPNETKGDEQTYHKTITEFSKDIVRELNVHLTRAEETSKELDSTYPSRLLEEIKTGKPIFTRLNDINREMALVGDRLDQLTRLGLIKTNNSKAFKLLSWKNVEKDKKMLQYILSIYIGDMNKKLMAYDGIAPKVEMFVSLVNSYLKDKVIRVDAGKGLVFSSKKGTAYVQIDGENLSSGEQNIVILFYSLLFKAEEGSIFLLDEPEISLHVTWQRKLVDDLLKIAQLNPIQICIATHSPSLISNHWKLTEELTGND